MTVMNISLMKTDRLSRPRVMGHEWQQLLMPCHSGLARDKVWLD